MIHHDTDLCRFRTFISNTSIFKEGEYFNDIQRTPQEAVLYGLFYGSASNYTVQHEIVG
jgi:hypothetical protein